MAEACQNCRFWDRSERAAELIGDCRRHPPRISETLAQAYLPARSGGIDWEALDDIVYSASSFPFTHEDSWCGEYAQAVQP